MKVQNMLSAAVVAMLQLGVSADCSCISNTDAGRWKDSRSPVNALRYMQTSSYNGDYVYYTADTQGILTVYGGTIDDFNCLVNFADGAQSYHGDWFLWTSITCNNQNIHMTMTL